MVEQAMSDESGGGGKLAMASSSTPNQKPLLSSEGQREVVVVGSCPLLIKESPLNFHPYPPPLATYEDVVASPKLFMDTLENLHAMMGTKFMIPIIGGKALDLHLLFVEVTSRGGIETVLGHRRWKEVTAVFSFPSSATNASFILRKYYFLLLHHYEQIYFFKAKGWTASHSDALQNESTVSASPTVQPSPKTQAPVAQPQRRNTTELPEPSGGSAVSGVIDGKFESGYLVTVTIGSEKLKGVLYQTPQSLAHHQVPQYQNVFANKSDNSTAASGVLRRKRRKKSEIKRRDPAHPKPNRSGYNFFFAEQRARLKLIYPGKDREISRMIGELWNKLQEPEKAVYQEKAARDKERYRVEMEDYKKRLEMDQIIHDAVPIQQLPLESDINMMEQDERTETEGADSPHTPGNEMNRANSERRNLEDDRSTADKDTDMGTSPGAEIDGENLSIDSSTDEETFELKRRIYAIGSESKEFLVDVQVGTEKESGLIEEKESVPTEERELTSSKERGSVFDDCP